VLRIPLVVLALALLAAAPARADDAAPGGASVTISPSDGGAPRTLALGDLTSRFDVRDRTYTLRAADGSTSSVTIADGISLGALLAAAGLEDDPFAYAEVGRPDGGSAIVLADRLGAADEGPPVAWADDQGVHFLRPSSGAGDANADDDFVVADGALAVTLRTGDPLVPRIAVSQLRARPGERIDFGASLVGGAPLGPGMEYQWYFADGSGYVLGANPSHRFPRSGTYPVILNVVRGADSVTSQPTIVRIRILAPRRERHAGGGARRSTESPPGGLGAGGTGSDPSAGHGGGSGGAGTGASGNGAGAPAPAPVPQLAPQPASPPARSRAAAPAPSRPRGQLVSGTLIAAASAAAVAPGGERAARAAAAGAASEGPLHVPVGVWVAIGLAALLGLGWALESRHTLPFWQP
jgi:hypothetical protein